MPAQSLADSVWRSLPPADVARVLEQIRGASVSAHMLETIARSLLVRRDGEVRFSAQRRQLGELSIAQLTMSGIRLAGLVTPRANTVHIGLVTEGAVTISPRDGEPTRFVRGDTYVIANWGAFDVASESGTRTLHLLVPESRLRARGIHPRTARFRLEGPRSLRDPLLALSESLVDPSWEPTPLALRVADRAVEDLAVALLTEVSDHELDQADLRAELRRRAIAEILLLHRDPDLTPTGLARHLGVSLRHLQRAYEGSGTTIAEQIARCRTDSAVETILAPGATFTLTEHARVAGFGSAHELRSAIRARYGVLPTELRRAQAIPAPESVDNHATTMAVPGGVEIVSLGT